MRKILPPLAGLALAAAQWFIWDYAPVEATMGLVQKIFYYHLPMSWWAMVSFFLVFAGSLAYLCTRNPKWDRLAGASAEIGVLLATLALVTGSLWARPIWNTWWTWDPRLTTTLIMWFVYAAYLLLRSAEAGGARGPMVRAVLGVVAFLDVPLVFYSARMWRSVHPAVFGAKGGGLEPEMWHTVLASVSAFGLIWLWMLLTRTSQLAQAQRLDALMIFDEEND
jgi:heme exporter protein C